MVTDAQIAFVSNWIFAAVLVCVWTLLVLAFWKRSTRGNARHHPSEAFTRADPHDSQSVSSTGPSHTDDLAKEPEWRVLQVDDFVRFTVRRGDRIVFVDIFDELHERDGDLKKDIEVLVAKAPDPWPDEVIVYGEGTSIYLPYLMSTGFQEKFSQLPNEVREQLYKVAESPEESGSRSEQAGKDFVLRWTRFNELVGPVEKTPIFFPNWWFERVIPETVGIRRKSNRSGFRIRNLASVFYSSIDRAYPEYGKLVTKDRFIATVLSGFPQAR